MRAILDIKRTDDTEPPAQQDTTAGARPRGRTVWLAVVAVAFTGLATWFGIEAYHARGGAAADNVALVDSDATAEVTGQVNEAVQRVFSYRFDDPRANERAARELVTGKARGQYERLFAGIRENAARQQIVLRSRVVLGGVQELHDDHAELLVFLDQSATRGDTRASSTGAAQLSVTAQRVDGRWRIADMRAR